MTQNKTSSFNQGSAYLFVLLVILLTSILGVSLFTFAYANLRESSILFNNNNAFYHTEACIAPVLVEVENQARRGQEKGKEWAEEHRDAIMSMATTYDSETGISTFNEELFKQEYEKCFCERFNQYICEDTDKEENGRKIILSYENKDGIKDIILPDYNEDLQNNPTQDLYVTVKAQIEDNSALITATFKILRESEISVKKVMAKNRNPIWMRAVTAEGDVIAVDGDVNLYSYDKDDPSLNADTKNMLKIAQAVYAWGTNNSRNNESGGTNATGDQYGGILAGVSADLASKFGLAAGSSGNLSIVGEAITDAYLHTFGNRSSILVDVNNGQEGTLENLGTDLSVPKVLADSIQTEEFSSSNSISIIGDAMVKDDLEMNGTGNNKIAISGSFLGISSGPENDYETNVANKSSSISYNDATESSKIDIGKYVVVSGVAYNNNVTYQSDPYKNMPYKSGESIAVGENHKIYRYYFNGEDINQSFDNGFKLKMNNTLFDYPLYSGKTSSDAPPNGVGNNRIKRFKDYLINYGVDHYLDYQPNLGDDIINIGSENNYKVEGYSLGVLPANGSLYFPLGFTAQDEASNAFQQGLLKAYDYIFGSDKLNSLKNDWNKQYNNMTWLGYKKDTRKTVSEFSSLVDESINYNANQLNEDGSIILKSTSGDFNIDMSTLNGKGGLIFARGNVIISGSGTFKGSIVAGGSVVFKGNGTKEIDYNEKNVLKAIRLSDNVRAALSKGGISEIDPDSVEIVLKAQRNTLISDYREVK